MTKAANTGRKPAAKKPPAKKPRKTTAKKAPSKKGKTKQPPRIEAATYNAMYASFKRQQSIANVAREVGVSYETAHFYIEGPAKPDYAMPPIKARYLKAERARQEDEDLTAAKVAKMRLKLVDAILNLAEGEGVLHQDDLKARLEDYHDKMEAWRKLPPDKRGEMPKAPVGMGLGALGKLVDRMVRTEQYLKGGYDKRFAMGDPGGRFANYSDEELLEHALTGRVPDHDRSANNEAANGNGH